MAVDQLTNVLTAISHPTRRAIIGQLAKAPARFLDIAEPFDKALNAVTKHLKMLERAGLIERQKHGREVLISLRGEPLREVAGWLHEYERFWNERLDRFQQYFMDKRNLTLEHLYECVSQYCTLHEGVPEDIRDYFHVVVTLYLYPYFRLYDLRSTYATRLSAGGVAESWSSKCFVRAIPRCSRSIRK